ncbi:MAG TPA: hypothetical protein VK171_08790 [Fimbriimonas sp.]|nr:hypothetical protein [Fimbriimonas sp.]
MPKVYVTQEVMTASYADAERYGDLVFLCASELSNVANSLHNEKLIAALRDRLSKFNPQEDFIAPSGSPIITGLVFAMLREKTRVFRVLKWNNRDAAYTSLTLDITGLNHVI